MEAPDFMTKYLPLIYILEDCEDDLAAIAKEEDYTRAIGRGWRDTHCKAVLGYTRAIRTDFEMLWQQTAAKVLSVIEKRSFLSLSPASGPATSSALEARSSVRSSAIQGMVVRCAPKCRRLRLNLLCAHGPVMSRAVALCSLCAAVATAVNAIAARDVARQLGDGNSARPAVVTNGPKPGQRLTAFASDPTGSDDAGLG